MFMFDGPLVKVTTIDSLMQIDNWQKWTDDYTWQSMTQKEVKEDE